mmetsp:Transcript_70521/g.166337  ORF Transcript_70521/g.166337 Transcript_70521/m.166337 type:complete len:240 (-) Transcript_70521:417-1136(-)
MSDSVWQLFPVDLPFTSKKRLVASQARFEYVVILHDNIALAPGFYRSFLSFDAGFDVAGVVISTGEAERSSLYCNKQFCHFQEQNRNFIGWYMNKTFTPLEPMAHLGNVGIVHDEGWNPWNFPPPACPADGTYSVYSLDLDLQLSFPMQRYCWFCGKVIVAKRDLLLRFPFIPQTDHGWGEDVLWALHLQQHVRFVHNPLAKVVALTDVKHLCLWPLLSTAPEFNQMLREGLVYYHKYK